jgi:hypothetical protein
VSWQRSRPGNGTVNPKYRTKEHRDTVNAYKAQLAHDGYLTCAQPICKLRSRLILPGMPWAAGHDTTGTAYIGPVHKRCNESDAGTRARARQTATRLRW